MENVTIENAITFENERESGERLSVRYTNWGDPYAEGARFELTRDYNSVACVDLTNSELRSLHALLGRLLEIDS